MPSPLEQILIVEDDAAQRLGLQQLVRSWGYTVDVASDGEEALQKLTAARPGIVLTDLVMPKMGGLDLLRAIQQQQPDIATILLTAQGTVDTAVEAIKLGAYDYLSKPIDIPRLRILLDKAVERRRTIREVTVLRRQLREHGSFGTMIGASAAMRAIYHVIEQAAPTTASVLVSGESGTGKEMVAQTIHQLSPRANGPFVPLNCAAIPEALLESELFGHEKGAFTGAITRRAGCFELADHGTLFLDEVAEMTPATQVKLLRVLQERSFRPVGSSREQTVDVRVVAATNADIADAVRSGKLREDLYYRLNVFAIALPPLRDRMDDVPLLIDAFVTEFNAHNNRRVGSVDPAAMTILLQHAWPGNVRELRNVIERATIVATGHVIQPADLPPLAVVSHTPSATPAPGAAAPAPAPDTAPAAASVHLTPGTTVDDAERRLIAITLAHTRNNKTHAARLLGISLKTLHNKLNRFAAEHSSGEGGEGE